MKICVFGLWHLGSVTAACMADAGHQVVGLDPDENVISDLNRAKPPLFEPGLSELVERGIKAERLMFTTDAEDAVGEADLVWVTFDTPVDDQDRADVDYVTDHVEGIFSYLKDGAVVLSSSQLPVGTMKSLRESYAEHGNMAAVSFAVSPENLRLGKAIAVFTQPDRVVVGVDDDHAREVVREALTPITDRIEWMDVASAEMTKHALNAFLATSVAFANEIAALCEQVGADAKAVERGLKSEQRIGPKAYLGPGGAFSGGTLARDISFLSQLANQHTLDVHLLRAVRTSNDGHKLWAVRRLRELRGELAGQAVTLLGLTYKPGTDTLRRSLAVETARALAEAGAIVHAYDPAVSVLPDELAAFITPHAAASEALAAGESVIVATAWPDFKTLDAALFDGKTVLDANGFLRELLGGSASYYVVGKS